MRMAAFFMSEPLDGASESPMPGRSGAMTVKRWARRGMMGFHICEVSAKPWRRIRFGP